MVGVPLRGAAGLARELQEAGGTMGLQEAGGKPGLGLQEAGGAPALTTAQPPRAELSTASTQCGWLQEKEVSVPYAWGQGAAG